MKELVEKLIHWLGGRYSRQLGINLKSRDSAEIFKWFLASILFGARISEGLSINTYKEFRRRNILSPQRLLEVGWDGLVEVLDAGGYVRYDFKTATKLLDIAHQIVDKYKSDLNLLHQVAKDKKDLERCLQEFKGIGPTTVNIFLRELRGIWEKAEPPLQDLVILGAVNLGLINKKKEPLNELKAVAEAAELPAEDFAELEVSLLKLSKNYCKKNKCSECKVREACCKLAYYKSVA